MKIEAPQIIMCVLLFVGCGLDLARHGEAKTGKINFGVTFVAGVVTLALLWWGGFFG